MPIGPEGTRQVPALGDTAVKRKLRMTWSATAPWAVALIGLLVVAGHKWG